MIELKGKRNSARIFAEQMDKEAKTQLAALLREEAYADSKIRVMPDVHSGKGCVIGMAMTLQNRVSPSLIGVDIGCGMETVNLGRVPVDLPALDRLIHERIPCGSSIHSDIQATAGDLRLSELFCHTAVDTDRVLRSLGTLGGGNHFIELDQGEDGNLWLVIHSGSRVLGSYAAEHYRSCAYRAQCKKARRSARFSTSERRDYEDGYASKAARRESKASLPVSRETAVLEGELFEQYLHDIAIIQEFADRNRRRMASIICTGMGWVPTERFSCVHNYIDTEHNILHKGSISARQGERVIIPLNMRDGAILGTGLGNPDWNFSAPHGAGRACSRSDAKHAYTVEEFQAQMSGIYTTTACQGSLDECPMAYKAPEKIIPAITETVQITERLRPVYNFKAC